MYISKTANVGVNNIRVPLAAVVVQLDANNDSSCNDTLGSLIRICSVPMLCIPATNNYTCEV